MKTRLDHLKEIREANERQAILLEVQMCIAERHKATMSLKPNAGNMLELQNIITKAKSQIKDLEEGIDVLNDKIITESKKQKKT